MVCREQGLPQLPSLSYHDEHLTWCAQGQNPSPAMMGTFCQARCRCCFWFSSVRQLGDLDASPPTVCSPCARSGELLILSVNWILCPVSTVRIETRSCEFHWLKASSFLTSGTHHSAVCCLIWDHHHWQDKQERVWWLGPCSCWCNTSLINAARSAVRGISK